jgi:hypothetical protein
LQTGFRSSVSGNTLNASLRSNMWWYRGEAKAGGVLVAEAELSAYLVKE